MENTRFKGVEPFGAGAGDSNGSMTLGAVLSNCAEWAQRRGISLRLQSMPARLAGWRLSDASVCLSALEEACRALSYFGRYPLRLSVSNQSSRGQRCSLEIALRNRHFSDPLSGDGYDLRLAGELFSLEQWLRENEIAYRLRRRTGEGITFNLFWDAYSPANGKLDLGAKGVLLVDDCRDSCELIAHLLRRWGYGVVVANSGEQAVKILDTECCFDIGIFDLELPRMSGEALAAYCRNHGDLNHMRLLSLSGKCVQSALGLFDARLEKPIGALALRDAISATLEAGSLEASGL